MASTKSLAQWCVDNNRNDLLLELDCEKNKVDFEGWVPDYIPNQIEHNSSYIVNWICSKGHRWKCEVVARTIFNLNCPICNPADSELPVGTKYGVLTIIGSFLNEQRCYICKCKCGKELRLTQFDFLRTKHRYCTNGISEKSLKEKQFDCEIRKVPYSEEEELKKYCGLAIEELNKKRIARKVNGARIPSTDYNTDYTGTIFESIEYLDCVNEHCEIPKQNRDLRSKAPYDYIVYKQYNSRCYLCGKEKPILGLDYYKNPFVGEKYILCKCHKISGFQLEANKVLFDNCVNYRVEYSFPDLLGVWGVNELRFDFAVFNDDGTIKCLIECQGNQHKEPVEKFGGKRQLGFQKTNDEAKRKYCQRNGIELIEIEYEDRGYDEIKEILKNKGII